MEKLTPFQFAKSIKEKYPEYTDVDDVLLANRMLEKYPVYTDRVDINAGTSPLEREQPKVKAWFGDLTAANIEKEREQDSYMNPDEKLGNLSVNLEPLPQVGITTESVFGTKKPEYGEKRGSENYAQVANKIISGNMEASAGTSISSLKKQVIEAYDELSKKDRVQTPVKSSSIKPFQYLDATDEVAERNLMSARKTLEDAEKILNSPIDKKTGTWFDIAGDRIASWGKGAGERLTNEDFWTMGMSAINRNISALNIAKKLEKGEQLRRDEELLLDSFANLQFANMVRADNMSSAYRGGQGTVDMASFIAQLATTGGLGRLATKGAEKALLKVIAKKVSGKFAQHLANTGTKILTRTGAAFIGAAIAPATFEKTTENLFGNALGEFKGIDLKYTGRWDAMTGFDSYINAWADLGIEFATEMSGGSLGVIGKVIKEVPGIDKVLKRLARTKLGSAWRILGNNPILKQAGIHGFFGEYNEEFDGGVARHLLRLEDFKESFWNWDAQATLLYTLGPVSGFSVGMNGIQGAKIKNDFKNSSKQFDGLLLKNGYSQQEIEDLKIAMLDASPEMLGQQLRSIVGSMDDGIVEVDGKPTFNEEIYGTALQFAIDASKFNAYTQGLDERLEEYRTQAKTFIEQNQNPDMGAIVYAEVAGKPVRVTKGNIVFNEDKLDRENSSSEFYYENENGEIIPASIELVSKLLEVTPIEQATEVAAQKMTAPLIAKEQNEEVRPYEVGEQVTIDVEGSRVMGQIVEKTENGYKFTDSTGMTIDIEPRQIIDEDNLQGVDNGVLVEYMLNGKPQTGLVEDFYQYRQQGQAIVDGNLVNLSDIIGIAQPETDSNMSEITPENEGTPASEDNTTTNALEGDPDLANIDPTIQAARKGDKQAQQKLEKFGLKWEQTTTYRFVGQSEVDVLLANERVNSKRGYADAGIDVTTSPKVTTAASNEYRVTFKESFDVNNGLGKVRAKNHELGDHNLEKGRGYDINDVAKIERLDENGNVVETVYDANATSTSQSEVEPTAAGETPVAELQAEQEKQTFIESLPVNNKGEIDQKKMTVAQTIQYFEYQYGVDETLKAAEQQVKNKEKQLKTAETALSKDPFNIAKKKRASQIQAELQEYKDYVFDKKKAKLRQVETSTSSIVEEKQKQEKRRAEAEAQRQAERAEIEALHGVPDVTVDKAKDARARGYRVVNGERVNRQEATTPTHFTETQRKFSEKVSVPVKRTIVEAETLQPSHKNGVKNDKFFITEAQPKPRTDDVSQYAAESIASNINPQEITGGVTAYTGAPIVNNHGEVIQGNNRVTGLQLMYEGQKKQAEKYKQYLIENAADYGMTAEQVAAMTNPVAVDIAEVSDEEAIQLGQLNATDTESGGVQRIPAQQSAVSLGEDIGRLSSILYESGEDDLSMHEALDNNGKKALEYLHKKGIINNTQFQSAFDSRNNLTPEAKKDLQDITAFALFEVANDNMQQMFRALPDKAQKAILQTIHRNAANPEGSSIMNDIRGAIEAYYLLKQDESFNTNTEYEALIRLATQLKGQAQLFNTETNLPLQKYSNFSIELAVLFKSDKQNTLKSRFNNLYDALQGVGGDMFHPAETLNLVEAIKKHFNNIDYVPNGQVQRNNVAKHNTERKARQQLGDEAAATREQSEKGEQPSQRGRGNEGNNKGKVTLLKGQDLDKINQELSPIDNLNAILSGEKVVPVQSNDKVEETAEKIKQEQKESNAQQQKADIERRRQEELNKLQPTSENELINKIKRIFENNGKPLREDRGKDWIINRLVGESSLTDALPEKDAQEIKLAAYKLREGKYNVTDGEKKEINDRHDAKYVDAVKKGEMTKEQAMQALEEVGRKDSDAYKEIAALENTKQQEQKVQQSAQKEVEETAEKRGESGITNKINSQDPELNPTEAQKEAGNYKKAHINIQGFDITIENPKGSTRSGVDENGREWSNTLQNHYGYFKRTEGKDGDQIDVFIGENPESETVFVVDQNKPTSQQANKKVSIPIDNLKEGVNNLDIIKDGKKIGSIILHRENGINTIGFAQIDAEENRRKGFASEAYMQLSEHLNSQFNETLNSGTTLTKGSESMWKSFVKKGLATKKQNDLGETYYTINPESGAFDESKVMLGFNTMEEAKAAYMSNYEADWKGFGAITPVSVEDFKEWLYDGKKQRKAFASYKGHEPLAPNLDTLTPPNLDTQSPEQAIKEFKYELMLRPFGIGTYPKDGFVRFEQTPGSRFGHVVMNRELPFSEWSKWDLNPTTSTENLKGKEFVDKDGDYSKITIDIKGGGADIVFFGENGQPMNEGGEIWLPLKDVFENIESGYWVESSPKQTTIQNDSKQKLSETESKQPVKENVKDLEKEKSVQKDKPTNKLREQISKLEVEKSSQSLAEESEAVKELRKEIKDLKSQKAKLIKDMSDRNGLFGDTKSDPNDLFGGGEVDSNAFVSKLDEINNRINTVNDIIKKQIKAEETGKTEAKQLSISLEEEQPEAPKEAKGEQTPEADIKTRLLSELNLPKYVFSFYNSLKKSESDGYTFSIYGKGFVPFNGNKINDFFMFVDRAFNKDEKTAKEIISETYKFDISQVKWADAKRIKFKNGIFISRTNGAFNSNANHFYAGTQVNIRDTKEYQDISNNEESSPKPTTIPEVKSEKLSETESEKAVSQEDKKSENDKSFPKEKSKEDKSGQKVEKIEDFGEKIEGAKKHLATLNTSTKEDITSMPLSKSFPKPDFKQLVESGQMTIDAAIVMNYLYENIPSKPRKHYKVARWINKVQGVIDTYNTLLENSEDAAKIIEKAEKNINEFKPYSATLKALGFPANNVSMGGYAIKQFYGHEGYSIVNGSFILGTYAELEDAAKALSEIINKKKTKTTEIKLNIYKDSKTGKYFVGRKGAVGVVRLIDGIETLEEARKIFKEQQPQLQQMWNDLKIDVNERRSTNSPRVGTDYRKGKDVTPEDFNIFGFRGVQFGNYVNASERQQSLNQAYDSLYDLANVLGISPKAISLNGELGLAFGARGSGGKNAASAHYEPGQIVINLTKKKGAGSLAHEWWHALDNYFERARGRKINYLTDSPSTRFNADGSKDLRVREEVSQAFKEVVATIKQSGMGKRSEVLDQARSKAYWSTVIEMSARSFENYIIEKLGETGQRNDYLANFKAMSEWVEDGGVDMSSYPYPTVEETPEINKAFDNLFNTIEETESGELREPELQYGKKLPSTININGVEKPTTNSEGKPIHSTEEGVRNFYEWFGDSKVVDEQGRPLVVYHGKRTPEQFYSFKKGMNFFSDNLPTAEMFAEENSHALIINGEKRSINKREAEEIQYIIEPYENLEWASGWDLWEDANEIQREALSEYLSTYLDYDSNIESLEINLPEEPVYGVYLNIKNPAVKDYSGKTWGEEGTHIEADMRNAISADNNIDGFVAKNISEGGFSAEINGEDPPVQTTYVTTNPNQIKSATSNTGEFSPEDASILNEPNINYQPKYKVSETGFYSTVEKALSAITQEKGTRDQFKAMLLKNGAKQAEMDWMGWDDQFPDATKKVSKEKQLDIIQSTNPMRDDYHVGIRKLEDIKTFDQVVDDSESFVYGDFSKEDAQKALKEGSVTVYSSTPIKNGAFVSTSEKQAKDYAGNGKVYSQKVNLGDVAWINGDEGQMAKADNTITKADIQNWIDANRIEVKEVQKGGFEWKGNDLIVGGEVVANLIHNEDGTWSYQSDFSEGEEAWETKLDAQKEAEEAIIGDPYSTNATKYSQYQLPGGENYKELLLTMPDIGKLIHSGYEVMDENGVLIGHVESENRAKELSRNSNGSYKAAMIRDQKQQFQSSHFDEPNILAHVRFNERIIPAKGAIQFDIDYDNWVKNAKKGEQPDFKKYGNDERVLFIEELQSDWAQEGKKKGFNEEEITANDVELRDDPNDSNVVIAYKKGDNKMLGRYTKNNIDVAKENAANVYNSNLKGVLDMPFKQTPQWVNLVARRMMRYAAENGFDRIAWTNGEQQVDRYDLSKQVDKLAYQKREGGYFISAIINGVGNPLNNGNTISENKLEEYVGKDVAEKIINGEGDIQNYAGNNEPRNEFKELSGTDLKVGGEGMKAFYDAIVPSAMSKLGKPFGAKVENVSIKQKDNGFTLTLKDNNGNVTTNQFDSKAKAYSWLTNAVNNGSKYEVISEEDGATLSLQQSIPVTDSMKKTASEGMPLFEPQQQFINFTPEEIQDETNKAHGSEEKRQEAINKTVEAALQTQISGDRREGFDTGRGTTPLRQVRTVLEGFKESGYVDFVGTEVSSHQDIADLWSIHRSPYIEKAHVIFIKDGKIAGSMAATSGRINQSKVNSPKEIAEHAKKIGATQVYLLHNHPSGIPDVSIPDVYVTFYTADQLRAEGIDLLGHVVVDHDKYSFIDATGEWPADLKTYTLQEWADKTPQFEYKNKVPKLYSEREVISSEKAQEQMFEVARNILSEPTYKGAIVYLTNHHKIGYLAIAAYDILPEGATKEDAIRIAREGLENNLGSLVVFVHDGSLSGTWGNTPKGTVDVINIAEKDSDYFFNQSSVSEPELEQLWVREGDVEYNPQRELLDAKLNKAQIKFANITVSPSLLREAYQDRHLPVRRFIEQLRETGLNIENFNDWYKQSTHLPGKIDAQLEAFERQFLTPMLGEIDKLIKQGHSYRDVENYAILKHGIERNEWFLMQEEKKYLEKNPQATKEEISEYLSKQPQDYSGITAVQEEVEMSAEDYIKQFEEKSNTDSFWNAVKQATKYSLDKAYEGQIINKDQYNELTNRYKYYIPLRGFDKETAEDRWDYTPDMGTYYVMPLIKAKGRTSRSETPFAFIWQMAQTSISSANKNLHNLSIKRLAELDNKRYASTGLMSISRAWYERTGEHTWELRSPEYSQDKDTYQKNIEEFENRMKLLEEQGLATQKKGKLNVGMFIKPKQAAQHEVHVMQNGEEFVVYFNGNPRVARAINGANAIHNQPNQVQQAVRQATRMMAANFTTRNPLFVLSNFLRDYNYASSTLIVKEGVEYEALFQKNIPLVMGALHRAIRGKADMTNKMDVYAYEYLMNGGRTGYSSIMELNRVQKRVERKIKKHGKENMFNVALEGLKTANEFAENLTRLSVYVTSREVGKDIIQSISDAKEVTVNFNRGGSGRLGGNFFKNYYLFFNANIQALANHFKIWKGNPGRMAALTGAYALSGFIAPFLTALIGGDDGEEEYMKLSDWERQTNFSIYTGNGFIKIPIAHELRVYHTMGDLAYQWMMGYITSGDAAKKMTLAVSDLIPANPMGATEASWAELSPDLPKPLVQLITNTSFMGTRIYDKYKVEQDIPGFRMVRTNKKGEAFAPEFLIKLAEDTHYITGGDGTKGGLDFNPDKLNHIMRGYFGGLYTMSAQAADISSKGIRAIETGEFKLKVRETPLKAFYASSDDLMERNSKLNARYYDIKKESDQVRKWGKDYIKRAEKGEISIDELYKKLNEINYYYYEGGSAVGINDFLKDINKMENMLKEVSPEEQEYLEMEINRYKKDLINFYQKATKSNKK